MYVVLIDFVRSLEDVDRLAPAHKAWLETLRNSATLVLSGRRDPRTGGVLVATAPNREALDHLLASDPFVVSGVATHTVIAFRPSLAADDLRRLIGQ